MYDNWSFSNTDITNDQTNICHTKLCAFSCLLPLELFLTINLFYIYFATF